MKIFDQFDTDGSGTISRNELRPLVIGLTAMASDNVDDDVEFW